MVESALKIILTKWIDFITKNVILVRILSLRVFFVVGPPCIYIYIYLYIYIFFESPVGELPLLWA